MLKLRAIIIELLKKKNLNRENIYKHLKITLVQSDQVSTCTSGF